MNKEAKRYKSVLLWCKEGLTSVFLNIIQGMRTWKIKISRIFATGLHLLKSCKLKKTTLMLIMTDLRTGTSANTIICIQIYVHMLNSTRTFKGLYLRRLPLILSNFLMITTARIYQILWKSSKMLEDTLYLGC